MWRRSSVGRSRASTGTWFARIPISPTEVLVESCLLLALILVLGGLLLLRLLLGCLGLGGLGWLLCPHALGRLEDLVNRALHVERPLGDVVVLAVNDLLEPADRLLARHVLALAARELRCDEERLR
jgi:hypothetical protein